MAEKTSLRETLSLAHSAQCKLHIAANRPDRNLRFVLGHALTLDNLTLRLVEIEDEMAVPKRPAHASGIQIRAANEGGRGSATRRRSPPPSRLTAIAADEEDDDDDDGEEDGDGPGEGSDDHQDELALTRFPSASAQPQRHAQPKPSVSAEPPPLDPSDDSSSSSDEDELDERKFRGPPPSEDALRLATKGNGDELLMSLYKSIKGCRCHGQTDTAPEVGRIWEVPAGEGEKRGDGVRIAVAEIAVDD